MAICSSHQPWGRSKCVMLFFPQGSWEHQWVTNITTHHYPQILRIVASDYDGSRKWKSLMVFVKWRPSNKKMKHEMFIFFYQYVISSQPVSAWSMVDDSVSDLVSSHQCCIQDWPPLQRLGGTWNKFWSTLPHRDYLCSEAHHNSACGWVHSSSTTLSKWAPRGAVIRVSKQRSF